MGSRGFTLLRLATLDQSERDAGWQSLVDARNERVTRRMLFDYARRGLVTSEDYVTMQLTDAGRARMQAVERIIADRESP